MKFAIAKTHTSSAADQSEVGLPQTTDATILEFVELLADEILRSLSGEGP